MTSGAHLSYRDIKQVVLDRIKTGIWERDTVLPSETALSEEFSSTRTTVNRALRELAEEGYLDRKRKSGTRVLAAPQRKAQFAIPLVRDEITATGAAYRYKLVERALIPAPDWLSAKLDLAPGQEVLHLRSMHYADAAPFQYETRWIVTGTVPEARSEAFEAAGPNDWLVQHVPFTNLDLSLSASKATSEIAAFLDMPQGDPVFTTERVTWLNGAAVTHARLYFAPGYRLTTQL